MARRVRPALPRAPRRGRTGARGRGRGAILVGAALLGVAPASAAADDAAMLLALARQDLRVASVAFRLLTASAALCPRTMPATGLVLHDLEQYAVGVRPEAARLFGLADRPAVLAVVPGSPADRAGILARDGIVRIAGLPVAAPLAPGRGTRKPSHAALGTVESRLADALARGAATLELERGGALWTVRLEPVPACSSLVQVEPGTRFNAWSDGRAVAVTSAVVAAAASDDELAAVIGHEIAHNILGHRHRLEDEGVGSGLFSRVGAKARKVRATEVEADYWGLYLAARAGYDPGAAAMFWRRVGAGHGGGIFADATHPGWREREAALIAAAAEIAAKRVRGDALVPAGAAAPRAR